MATAALILFIYFMLFFIVAQIIKNNSIVDIGWGFGFVLVVWVLFFLSDNQSSSKIIVNVLVSLWGLRLFYYILRRNLFEKEDFRYANWRKAWGKWVVPRAFLQVFMLQGFLMFLVGYGVFYFNVNDFSFTTLGYVGLLIHAIGFHFQMFGDAQLKRFIKDPNTSGLCEVGLWKYTRHPNYFGEMLMWWGLFIIVVSSSSNWFTIISPLTISAVLIFISTPILEASMSKRDGWDEYAKKTNRFIPWLPKK